MAILSKIWGATIGKIADGASNISGDITKVKLAKSGDKTQVEANASLEQLQVLKQYASEFTGKQGIVEKFNKLVRPLFAITAWVVFGVRYLTPMIIFITKDLTLNDLMEIYNILWVSDKWIIGGIIGFYFGGRMQTKSHDNKNGNLLNEKIAGILASKPKRRKSGDDLHSMEGVNSKPKNIITHSTIPKVQRFVLKYRKYATDIEERFSINRIGALAHCALETGWGEKILTGFNEHGKSVNTNNMFNIKAGQSWKGEKAVRKVWEMSDGKNVFEKSAFRVYDDIDESFIDYAKLLQKKRYKKVVEASSVEEFAHELYEAGYMTDEKAADKIIKISKMLNISQ